jgi:hypothetical protein
MARKPAIIKHIELTYNVNAQSFGGVYLVNISGVAVTLNNVDEDCAHASASARGPWVSATITSTDGLARLVAEAEGAAVASAMA